MTGSPFFLVFISIATVFYSLFGWMFSTDNNYSQIRLYPSNAYYHKGYTSFEAEKPDLFSPIAKLFGGGEEVITPEWTCVSIDNNYSKIIDIAKSDYGNDVFTLELVKDAKGNILDPERYLHEVIFQSDDGKEVRFYLYSTPIKDNHLFQRKQDFLLGEMNISSSCYDYLYMSYTCKTNQAADSGYWQMDYNSPSHLYYAYRNCLFKSINDRSHPEVTFDMVLHIRTWDSYNQDAAIANMDLEQYIGTQQGTVRFGYFAPDKRGKYQAVDAIQVTYCLELIDGEITGKVISEEHIPVSELNMLK